MTIEEFFAGSQVEEPGMPYEEVEGHFKSWDENGDWRLSKKEFISGMGGGHGEDRDQMKPDEYWQKFSSGGHMSWEDFAEAYNHSTPGVS
jgi:Ca2+-binding EF-hand superfamily protein